MRKGSVLSRSLGLASQVEKTNPELFKVRHPELYLPARGEGRGGGRASFFL